MKARYVITFDNGKKWIGEWFDLSSKSIMAVEYESSCLDNVVSHANSYYLEFMGA